MPDESAKARIVRLGDLGRIFRGRGGTKLDARDSGTPCVRYGDLYTHHDCVIRDYKTFIAVESVFRYTSLVVGDVVFAASGETQEDIGRGAAYVSEVGACAGADTLVFRPGTAVDSRFLGYSTNTNAAGRFKARFGQGSSVFHISAAHLTAMPLWLPQLAEQRCIADILDTVDDAIRQTERVIAKLEQVKAGMLQDLLTRGIDDNGEVRDPERHPEQFKDSPLGRIPKGWEVETLATLANEITSGATPTSGSARYYCDDGGLPFAKIDDLTASPTRFIERTSLQVTRTALRETSLVEYPVGTLLLSMYGTIGLVKTTARPMCANQALAALLPPFRCEPSFLAHVLEWCRPKWERFKAQTTQANINGRIVKEFLLSVPPEDEQRRIAERLTQHEAQVRREDEALAKLRATKQALADDLLTGRVRVNPREAVSA